MFLFAHLYGIISAVIDMKKIVFIDVDGTIYKSHQTLIDESISEALKELSEHADIYLATGRCLSVTAPLGDALKYFKGYVLSNGAFVVKDQNVILNEVIKPNDLVSLIETAKTLNLNVGLITNDLVYVNEYTQVVDLALSPYLPNSVIDLHGYQFDLTKEYNMAWCFNTKAEIAKFKAMCPAFDVFNWGEVGGDIIIKDVSKAHGIKHLLASLNEKDIITYAIGDSNNDLEMFDLVDVAICMQNGSPDAKMKAKYITESIYDAGFEKATKRIIEGEW